MVECPLSRGHSE